MKEYIYCVLNQDNEIQTIHGSSTTTRYYKTRRQAQKPVDWVNKYADDQNKWRVGKFELVEVEE